MNDMNGKELKVGQKVKVHHSDGSTEDAELTEIREEDQTVNEPGCWCEILTRKGSTGMMSYILEVIE